MPVFQQSLKALDFLKKLQTAYNAQYNILFLVAGKASKEKTAATYRIQVHIIRSIKRLYFLQGKSIRWMAKELKGVFKLAQPTAKYRNDSINPNNNTRLPDFCILIPYRGRQFATPGRPRPGGREHAKTPDGIVAPHTPERKTAPLFRQVVFPPPPT